MTLLGFIRHLLALLATILYWTAGNSSPYFDLILVCPVTISFLFQRGNLLKAKLMHILKRRFQYWDSYIRKEKSKLNFKILKSVFMDDMSYRYREWANPVAYVCTESSRSGSEAINESESNSDEGSSHDENEDNVEKGTEMVKIVIDDSVMCISSTKAVFESLTASEITHTQKRKAESEKSDNPKRSKSRDSLEVGEASKQTEITGVNIKTSSETSSCYNNEETSSISDPKLTHVHDKSSKCDQIDVDELLKFESQSIEKSEDIRFPSQVSSPLRDKKSGVEDLHQSNSKDKSVKSSGRERLSSRDSALQNTVPVCQTERRATKSTQTENKKSYPYPKLPWKNLMQDESCNTPSDPRKRENYKSISEYRLGRSGRLRENQSFEITQDTRTQQNTTSDNNTETSDAEKYSKSSTDSSKNVMECPYIFPEINISAILLKEHCKQLKNLESRCFDASENISEITRQFFENFRNENRKEAVQTSNENVSLECPSFSREIERNSESSDINSASLEGPGVSSVIHPCSSTEVSSVIHPSSSTEMSSDHHPCPSTENKSGSSKEKDICMVKVFPGLSSQPLDVKKDALHQKCFFKRQKGIALPKELGKVIQWAANKPRDDVTIPTSDIPHSDETDLPTDEHHDQRQVVALRLMTIFDKAKDKRARKKVDKECHKKEKERMKRENTGYIESSYKEESPSSESSSDSLPTSEDSPRKAPTPPVSRPIISADYDISMIQISPLKSVAKVSPRFSPQEPPRTPNFRHLFDDEIVYKEASSDSGNLRDSPVQSVLIKFIDSREVVNPKDAIFDRDILWIRPSQDASEINQREILQKLKPFFRIKSVAPVSCTPISVEEFLYELRKTQEIYYQAYYKKQNGVFEAYWDGMTICVIPLRLPQSPDSDCELDEEDEVTLGKREHHTEPEHNFAPFAPDSDHILDENKSEREIETESRIGAKSGQKLREQVTSQANNMHQSHEVLARDSSARTFRKAEWNLRKIDFGENKATRERSGEHSCLNIPTQGQDIRIESKMEEWPADAYQSHATSAEKVEKNRPGSNDSSMETLSVIFGYPSPEFISEIMKLTNIPNVRQRTVSYSGSGQRMSPNRKTRSESSINHRSNFLSVELKNPPQETQTTCDVSNLCQETPAACSREKLARKQSETENPMCCTETNLNKCTTVRKNKEPFESNPIIVASGEQESPGGHGFIAEEKSVNKESSSSSSAVEKNTESIKTYDITYKLRSKPEKDNLSATDVLEISSDPDDNKDSEDSEKEQSKK